MKRKDFILYLFSGIITIFMVYLTKVGIQKRKSLETNLEYTNAIILKFSSGPRGRRYIDYAFSVNGTKYQGSGKHYPQSDHLSIGDTIVIVYDKTNPASSKPERDF
jgi:hypothetical protein